MADEQKKRDETLAGVFSINFDEKGNSTMPGVTQLINPEVLKKRQEAAAAAAPKVQSKEPEKKNSSDDGIQISLDDGKSDSVTDSAPVHSKDSMSPSILLELQFENENGQYRFARFKAHQKNASIWQEHFFSQMKLDLKLLQITGDFQEFEASKHPFHQDAFGLSLGQFMQMIHAPGSNQIQVLFSTMSLGSKKDEVLESIRAGSKNAQANDRDEFKIELA